MKKIASGAEMMSTILSFTEALRTMYEHLHWRSSGVNYYGDHLLYERLYDSVTEEIDAVAEKTVGIFGDNAIGPNSTSSDATHILSAIVSDEAKSDEFPSIAIKAEEKFIEIIKESLDKMSDSGELTDGMENMLQDIVDTHEGHLYLLKQRAEKKEAAMLPQLYKLAYHLDQKGLYDEANEIEKAMEVLADRVGLEINDMIALADYFDGVGDHALADHFDEMVKESAKKPYKGPGEKPPKGSESKAPKGWFDKMKKDIKKENPDYSEKEVSMTVGDIWDNKLSDKERAKINKKYRGK